MKKCCDIVRQFGMMVMAVVACFVLLSTVVLQYHHHDYDGVIHYCIVCNHVNYKPINDCSNRYIYCLNDCRNIPLEDKNCALHIDKFFYDDSYIQQCKYCLGHYTCCFVAAVLLYQTCYITGVYSQRVDGCYVELGLFDNDLSANVLRGPPQALCRDDTDNFVNNRFV